MKTLKELSYLCLLTMLPACSGFTKSKHPAVEKPVVLHTNSPSVAYSINNKPRQSWKPVPERKPDLCEIECKTANTEVQFSSEIDSVKFNLQADQKIRFYIVHGSDSALTELVGLPKNVNFSDEYVKAHAGKTDIEIPEVQELANILVAISRVGQLDSNMVDMTTPYYKEVMAHFLPFKNHPIIDTINQHIVKPLDTKSYWYYYALKMNACAYVFEKDGSIRNEGIILKMGFSNEADPIKIHTGLISDFAKKSGFRKFYREHENYYQNLITTYATLNPLNDMQDWLQKKFGMQYNNYRIIFSPLVGGAHATMNYSDNGLEQTVMFVRRAKYKDEYSQNLNAMLNSQTVFTEIDHNFVNPVSNTYLNHIDQAFSNRAKWVKEGFGTNAYNTPYRVFNEYMTWGMFSLYCADKYPETDLSAYLQKIETQMVTKRGFIHFPKFNRQLLALHRQQKDMNINALYEAMLQWSEKENAVAN